MRAPLKFLSEGVKDVPAAWPQAKTDFLYDKWGTLSVPGIAKKLGVSKYSILNKVNREGLGPYLENGNYITINQLFKAIGRTGGYKYTLGHWLKKGFPLKYKQVISSKFMVVEINEFWKWAQENRMHINFSKFRPLVLGEEPNWVADQRKADVQLAKYKVSPWTNEEDQTFINYIKLYRYTYRDISIMMKRTEGALRRRISDLGLKEWPLREPPHGIWTEEEINTVISMYNKGYRPEVIKEHIKKSAHAIEGKISRLIKEGRLVKWR